MKTVAGKVITTTPISLSKAAKVLSNFVATDTGAPQAVSVYLRRATVAFDELVKLHKDLKPSRKIEEKQDEDREREKHRKKRKKGEDEERETEGVEQSNSQKKKKKKRRIESEQ